MLNNNNKKDIFVDRRKNQQPLEQPCRRGFGNTLDSKPWWLKANYLTQEKVIADTQKPNAEKP